MLQADVEIRHLKDSEHSISCTLPQNLSTQTGKFVLQADVEIRHLTETDIRVCFLHATNITTIGAAREFRKVGKRFSEI